MKNLQHVIPLFLFMMFSFLGGHVFLNSISQKQSESYYQKEFARLVGGEMEVVLSDRTRVDVVTNTHAIEVDFASKWAESIGQALHYEKMLEKQAGVLLIIDYETEKRFLDRLMGVAVEHGIDVWTWDYTNDTCKKVVYKLIY